VRQVHGEALAARFRVVPGWVDLSRFRVIADREAAKVALGWPTDRPVLFCLRRFVPRMGLEALIDAAASLRASGRVFHLVMGGDGPLRENLVARTASLGLAGAVSFPGRAAEDLLATMYGCADAFVLPTAELECFGLIAIEALACGRPVLATPVGAIPEVVGQVEPRWIAGGDNHEALAALIGAFLDGRLPIPPPERLSAFVAQRYSMHDRVAELARLVIGEPEAA
jgi:glycosyltransferase involved in cell wall biosynthesis